MKGKHANKIPISATRTRLVTESYITTEKKKRNMWEGKQRGVKVHNKRKCAHALRQLKRICTQRSPSLFLFCLFISFFRIRLRWHEQQRKRGHMPRPASFARRLSLSNEGEGGRLFLLGRGPSNAVEWLVVLWKRVCLGKTQMDCSSGDARPNVPRRQFLAVVYYSTESHNKASTPRQDSPSCSYIYALSIFLRNGARSATHVI